MNTILDFYKKKSLLPKHFTKNFAMKSIAVGSFIFGIFLVGFLLGNGMNSIAKADTSSDAVVMLDTPLFKTVKEDLDTKFIFWKSSSSLPTNKDLEYGMIRGYVESFKDPYTVFFPPQQAKSFAENVKGKGKV